MATCPRAFARMCRQASPAELDVLARGARRREKIGPTSRRRWYAGMAGSLELLAALKRHHVAPPADACGEDGHA